MNPEEPASSYKEANESSANKGSHQSEMVSRQRRCQAAKRSSCITYEMIIFVFPSADEFFIVRFTQKNYKSPNVIPNE